MPDTKITRTNPVYNRYIHEWRFFWQAYEGGQNYIDPGGGILGVSVDDVPQLRDDHHNNLFRHQREDAGSYIDRIKRAFYVNFCHAIIETYISHLNKVEPAIDVEDVTGWDEFTKDVNRQGDSLIEFRRDVQTAACVVGHCFVIVDKPQGKAESAQDESDKGLFPFYTLFYPWDVLDWQLDEFGEPWWVKVVERDHAMISPTDTDLDKKRFKLRYKIWTREDWTLFDAKGEVIGTDTHPLGVVPIVPVYNKKRQKSRFLGISAINDIAYINRSIFNIYSLIGEFCLRAGFPMLKNPKAAGQNANADKRQVGATTVFDYPDQSKHEPGWMSPPTEPLEFQADEIERETKNIYRLARLEAGFEPRSKQPQTAESKAFDWMDTSTVLQDKASNFEESEIKEARLWLKWMNIEPQTSKGKDKISIDYPESFDVSSIETDLNNAMQIESMFISEEVLERELTRIVLKIDPKMDAATLKLVKAQIKTGVAARFAEQNFGSRIIDVINDDEGGDK